MANYATFSDGALQAWYTNFVDVALLNAAALDLDLGEQTVLTTARDDFDAARTARANAAAAAIASTVDKNDNRAGVLALVGLFNNGWQANPLVPDTLIGDLGLTVHDETPSQIGVFTPLNFFAEGNGNGEVKLNWSRNGNVWGCSFWLEVSFDEGATWQIASSSTKAKATLTGVTIRPTAFRVRAERNGQISSPSSAASLYLAAGPAEPVEPPLEIAA